MKFYCVGYTIIRYYLNGYQISNLQGHKAKRVGADLITTFLPDDVVDGLYKAVEMAGLEAKHYSVHKLRHTAATLMLQNGVDVRTLQEVLGHDNLNTTQIYTHVDSSELRIAAAANPLANFDANE